MIASMNRGLPLSALLSQALVAFTIEFDNEFEHHVPHRTTNHGPVDASRDLPWLVSMTMWLQFMRWVPEDGIPAKELYGLTGLSAKSFRTWLVRMSKWWGYVTVSEMHVRPTPGGLKAIQVWRPLTETIEKRWQERFGERTVAELRDAMRSIVENLGTAYPDYLPILGYGLLQEPSDLTARRSTKTVSLFQLDFPILLSKVLLAFALEFERASKISLALSANLLRLTGDDGVRVRDLPQMAGVSKEAVAMALRRAQECAFGEVQQKPRSRMRIFVLSAKGRDARDTYSDLVWRIDEDWKVAFGEKNVQRLRERLEQLIDSADSQGSLLHRGLKPYPDGWRALVPALQNLPHYPMVLHRGGFPDGS